MAANRCSMCGLDWPRSKEYKYCPQCLEKTDPVKNCDPMDADEARSLKLHLEFDRFYEEEWPKLRDSQSA